MILAGVFLSLSPSSFFLVVFFFLLFALSGWMCRKVGGGLCRPWIYRSIHLSTASLFFVFFLLFCCTQWKLTREIRNYGERTTSKTTTETASPLFLFFCTVSFSFSLSAWNAEKMRRHTLSLPLGFANYEERTEQEKARGKPKNKNRKFFPWLQPCHVRVDRKREGLARSMAQFVLSFFFPFVGFFDDRREKHRPRQRRMPFRRSSSAVAITQISSFIYRLNTRRNDVQSKMSMQGPREIF